MALITPETAPKIPTPIRTPRHQDGDPYDIRIRIAEKSRQQIWTANTDIKNVKQTRIGGRIQGSSATAHSLLAVATIAALRSIGGERLARLQGRTGDDKPRVLITTEDKAFADGLKAFIASKTESAKLRAGKNFWRDLTRQLERFKVTVNTTKDDDPRCAILGTWGVDTIVKSEGATDVPSVFRPIVVVKTTNK